MAFLSPIPTLDRPQTSSLRTISPSTQQRLFIPARRRVLVQASPAANGNNAATPRRRGRPRKNPLPADKASANPESNPSTSTNPQAEVQRVEALSKRRGRPKKNLSTDGADSRHSVTQAPVRSDSGVTTTPEPIPAARNKESGSVTAGTAAAVVSVPSPSVPLTQAEQSVLTETQFADGRYGSCFVCGSPVAIPGLERFFCGACGWVKHPVETETISPGHHD